MIQTKPKRKKHSKHEWEEIERERAMRDTTEAHRGRMSDVDKQRKKKEQ